MDKRNWNQDWDHLGKSVSDAVDQAINSQDFQKLNQTICDTMANVIGTGSDAVRKVVQTAQDRYKYSVEPTRKQSPYDNQGYHPVSRTGRYASTGGFSAVGVIKTVFGGLLGVSMGFPGLLTMLGGLILGEGAVIVTGAILTGIGAGGGALLGSGVKDLTRLARFKQYTRLLGDKTHCRLELMAKNAGKTVEFVRSDVQTMINRGWFLEGHLDHEGQTLINSNDTYFQYEQARLKLLETQKELARIEQEQKSKQTDPRVVEVMSKGGDFLKKIRRCNDRIPGAEISAKIFTMEKLVESLIGRAYDKPESVPNLKKLMDYYLPMAVKLLEAYAEMDAQPVQGETIRASKKEIEDSLDTLNLAFEKLLDSVFQNMALDVSSDISVLQTMLAQEGLTDDGMRRPNK